MTLSPYISYNPIGNGGRTAENPRQINRNNGRLGGKDDFHFFFDNEIERAYQAGFRRFHLHHPFGIEWPKQKWTIKFHDRPDETWEIEQTIDHYLECLKDARYTNLCATFEPAAAKFLATHSDCELIAYTGQGYGHPKLEAMGSKQERFRYLTRALSPFINSGCSIAFDSACFLPENHWQSHYMHEVLPNLVPKIYIESQPWGGPQYFHLDRFGVISDRVQWSNANRKSIARGEFMDPANIRGERIAAIWAKVPPNFDTVVKEFYHDAVPKELENFDAVTLTTWNYIAAGGTTKTLDEACKGWPSRRREVLFDWKPKTVGAA